MDNDIDASNGSEDLTIDQAAAAYAKVTSPEAVQTDQAEDTEQDEGDETTDDELQATEEAAGEEDEGETGEEDETGSEEEDQGEDYDKGRFAADNARVKLGDEIIPISELKAGYLKNADATKKWQDAAELRKSAETQSATLKASEEQFEKERELVITLVKNIIPARPDPAKADPRSDKYDPAGYQAEQVAFEGWANYLTQLETDQQRAEQGRQAETAKETEARVQKEWTAALEKMPELKDGKKLEAFGQKTIRFGTEYGYTPQELANIHHDHRQLLVMRDAIKWRELQASKATVQKKVENRPPVQRGGKRLNHSENKARATNDAMTRLQSSGSERDAVAALLAMQSKG